MIPIEDADCEALALLHTACFKEAAWSAETFQDFFTSTKWGQITGWVTLENAETCGFILARQVDLDCETLECEILTFSVHPSHQGKGIGRALLKKLLETVSGPIFLEVAVDNGAALHLYKTEGFKVVGTRPNYYTGKEPKDAYLMRFEV